MRISFEFNWSGFSLLYRLADDRRKGIEEAGRSAFAVHASAAGLTLYVYYTVPICVYRTAFCIVNRTGGHSKWFGAGLAAIAIVFTTMIPGLVSMLNVARYSGVH